jgi:hypothetical protein
MQGSLLIVFVGEFQEYGTSKWMFITGPHFIRGYGILPRNSYRTYWRYKVIQKSLCTCKNNKRCWKCFKIPCAQTHARGGARDLYMSRDWSWPLPPFNQLCRGRWAHVFLQVHRDFWIALYFQDFRYFKHSRRHVVSVRHQNTLHVQENDV